MKSEEARIRFYSISQCGYYRSRQDGPSFGGIQEVLGDLISWVKDKSVEQTSTYSLSEESRSYRTFCYDTIKSEKEEYLITTWNELPASKGNAASVAGKGMVGNAAINLTEHPKDYIPGYAAYFWFLPSKNKYATIQFQHNENGRKNLEKYIRNFLAKFSKNVVFEEDKGLDHDIKPFDYSYSIQRLVKGYAKDPSAPPEKLFPRFESYLYERDSRNIEKILNDRSRIKKITKKSKLLSEQELDVEFFQKILQNLGISEPQIFGKAVNFLYEIPNFSPTENELREIINTWRERPSDDWDDIGFELEGESRTYWLSKSFASGLFPLEISRNNKEIVNTKTLLDALEKKRSEILTLIN